MGAERTEIASAMRGTGRTYAELKNSICPYSAQREFMGAERTEIASAMRGTGRTYAELKIRKEQYGLI